MYDDYQYAMQCNQLHHQHDDFTESGYLSNGI